MVSKVMKTFRAMNGVMASLGLMIPCFMLVCFSARSAPLTGSWAKGVELESKVWLQTNKFRGGERAAVLAIGDHKDPGAKLRVAVYDAKGVLIAEDKGESELASDYVGLVWYPPRDGDYRVEVSHSGAGVNSVYIAIK